MDHEVLREMQKALEKNKTLEKLTLIVGFDVSLLKEFCHHVLLGTRRNTSLSDIDLRFNPQTWECPYDGRLVYVSHILCDSVGCILL